MPEAIPACFRGRAAAPAESTAAAGRPSETTCVYQTRIGLAALSWRRAAVGISLRVHLRIDGDGDGGSGQLTCRPPIVDLRVWPCLLWRRRGSRRFPFADAEIAWDLSGARFPDSGGPEPASGFYVSVSVAGEPILVAGDLVEEASCRRRSRSAGGATSRLSQIQISRLEQVALGGQTRSYRTSAWFGGRDLEISVELVGKEGDLGMDIAVDGKRVLHVRRIRWKFRGSECAEIGGGDQIRISWDLHSWLFPPTSSSEAAPDPPAGGGGVPGRAVFVFRFERDVLRSAAAADIDEGACPLGARSRRNWCEFGGGEAKGMKSGGGGSSLQKQQASSSVSSSSSLSSGGVSSVIEWSSPEEAKLLAAAGFTLLIYAWKC